MQSVRAARKPGGQAASAPRRAPPEPLWRLRLRDWMRFLGAQPVSFWMVCAYLIFEYVRPQSIYPAIDVLPWGQTTIVLALLSMALEKGVMRFPTPIWGGLVLYTAVVVLSSLSAWDPAYAWAGFIEGYLSWIVIYVLIVNTVTDERRYLVFWMLFMLSSFKMSQHAVRSWAGAGFAFRDWGVAGAPGWFSNSGEFGVQMCIFLPMSLYFALAMRPYLKGWRLWFLYAMPASAVIGVIGSSSRGAMLGSALIALWLVARSRHRVRAFSILGVVALLVWVATPSESKDRFAEMGDDPDSVHRLTMWEHGIEMANDRPVLGVGYRNFSPYYIWRYEGGLEVRTSLPHNIFIEAWSEMGYVGLFAFLTLVTLTFVVNGRTRRIAKRLGERGTFLWHAATGLDGALVGFIGSGFFVTVLYYPFFWVNLAMTTALWVAATDTARRSRQLQGRRRPGRGGRKLALNPQGVAGPSR